jgi:hypothetical protein
MNTIAAILVRHLLTLLAGWLASKQITDAANASAITNGLLPGIMLVISLIWSHAHCKAPLPSPKALGVVMGAMVLGLATLTGCTTALDSTKIITVKQRCFGVVVETAGSTTTTPNVKLGFSSTVWEMLPTSTNHIYAPDYMDTYAMSQSINPFATDVSENTGTGTVEISTNGQASVIFRPWSTGTNAPPK